MIIDTRVLKTALYIFVGLAVGVGTHSVLMIAGVNPNEPIGLTGITVTAVLIAECAWRLLDKHIEGHNK